MSSIRLRERNYWPSQTGTSSEAPARPLNSFVKFSTRFNVSENLRNATRSRVMVASAASGYPLLANPQSSAFSIFRIFALPFSLGRSFAVEAALKLLLALTFTYLFCRRRHYAELPSGIGALCFGFSTFMMIWLHFPLGSAAAFLPAVIYCADALINRVTLPMIAFTAVVAAATIFCGHPETFLHIVVFTTLYVAWIVLVERPFATPRDAARRLACCRLRC